MKLTYDQIRQAMNGEENPMRERTILSSGRPVLTMEENDCFYVFHRSYGYEAAVSGPFPLNDPRFSEPR